MEDHWTFLDLIFAVIILISTALALTKGLMREIISLVSLLGGFLVAAFYYWKVASFLVSFTKTQDIANLLGFLTIFVGVLLVGALVSFLVNRFLKKTSLEWADRLIYKYPLPTEGALTGPFPTITRFQTGAPVCRSKAMTW